ncbi:MAG: hypothetical protein LC749_01045 [Actinobacteria bacterium]|nr:hypothetical protein [Actinomycetota bacterium]
MTRQARLGGGLSKDMMNPTLLNERLPARRCEPWILRDIIAYFVLYLAPLDAFAKTFDHQEFRLHRLGGVKRSEYIRFQEHLQQADLVDLIDRCDFIDQATEPAILPGANDGGRRDVELLLRNARDARYIAQGTLDSLSFTCGEPVQACFEGSQLLIYDPNLLLCTAFGLYS